MSDRKITVITIAVEVISTGIVAYMLWRTFMGPDVEQRTVMRICKTSENFAQKQAQSWAHIADGCRKLYDTQRNVTV